MNKSILRTNPSIRKSTRNIKEISNKLNNKLINKMIKRLNLNLGTNINWFRDILPSNLIDRNTETKYKEMYCKIKFFMNRRATI